MSTIQTIKYYSDALEKIFWKGYEYHSGREYLSLRDMEIDAKLIAADLGVSQEFLLHWINIVKKEMGLKLSVDY
jgi:hypothetical protein